MRLKHLICEEFRLLFKYGIIFLYVMITAIYLGLLAAIPDTARELTTVILVFTDPAAMGLFFMGAVVLFEKSQRIDSSLAVAPIKISEYMIAKVLPIMVIGMAVSVVLYLFAGSGNVFLVLLGVALASMLLSLCGLLIGSRIQTLNSFMIATIPFEIVICVPPLLYLAGILQSSIWILHPGVAAIRLIRADASQWYLSALSIVLWMIPIYYVCKKSVIKSFHKMGGAKI
ncbi:MAG: hypothetical protein PHW34_11480 [Hespellia sp.]|nr:hypothetical protein [Hespellia sp.]